MSQKDDQTLAHVQFASMNMGLIYVQLAERLLPGGKIVKARALGEERQKIDLDKVDAGVRHYLEMALNRLYFTLSVSTRIAQSVQSTCAKTLDDIYATYYGDMGTIACDKLYEMFPSAGLSAFTANFLIDVSPSMNGNRIISCQDTLRSIVQEKMSNDMEVSVHIFPTLIPRTRLTVANRSGIYDGLETLHSLAVKGRTFFYKSLLILASKLLIDNPAGPHWIVALTDGEDNGKCTTAEEAKLYCKENKINVVIISVGLDVERVLKALRFLASDPQYFIESGDSPENITDALMSGFEKAATGNVMMEAL